MIDAIKLYVVQVCNGTLVLASLTTESLMQGTLLLVAALNGILTLVYTCYKIRNAIANNKKNNDKT